MKTGFAMDDSPSISDKTIMVSLLDAFVQEIIKLVALVSYHNKHISVVNQELMLKCIKFAILHPSGIGEKMNTLLNFVFDSPEHSTENEQPPAEIAQLVTQVTSNFSKHHTRLSNQEQKHNEMLVATRDQPSYMRPSTHEGVTKPVVKQLLADYFETTRQEEEDEEEEDEEEEDEEEEVEEMSDTEAKIESVENSTLSCTCDTCKAIMEVGEIRKFYPQLQQNPFVKAIFNSLNTIESKFGKK